MEILQSNINSNSEDFKNNTAHHRALADELKQRLAKVREGGGEKYRARQESQGKLFVRERIERLLDPGSPFLELSALAAWDLYEDQARGVSGSRCRHRHWHRARQQSRSAHRRQRRHRQRWLLLPDDGQETSARPADRRRESSALPVSRRFGRGVFAPARRSLSRCQSLRSHLLQSGAHVRQKDSADRGGDGQLHGGRRLRPCDERRSHHRQRHGHDLPRRTSARQSRDGRRCFSRRPRRSRRSYTLERCRRSFCG